MKSETKFIMWLIIVCLVATFMIMPFRIKAETFGSYPASSKVPLTFSCQNSTYLNISRIYIYPNGTNIINIETITSKAGNVYNYTVSSDNTTNIGTYVVAYHCNLNAIDTPANSYFTIDNSGYSFSTGDSIVLIMAFAAIGILVLVFFVYGMKSENPVVKIFCFGLAVLFIVFLFGFGYNIFNTILGKYPSMAGSLNSIYILLIVLLTCAGAGLMLWLIAFAMTSWSKYRGFKD